MPLFQPTGTSMAGLALWCQRRSQTEAAAVAYPWKSSAPQKVLLLLAWPALQAWGAVALKGIPTGLWLITHPQHFKNKHFLLKHDTRPFLARFLTPVMT